MLKVIIGVPCYDGKVSSYTADAIINAVKQSVNIRFFPIFLCFDPVIQRCRNEFVKLALENDCDSIIFVDSDLEFNFEWLSELALSKEDVIGGTYRIKDDLREVYSFKGKKCEEVNGLFKIDALPGGFMKISDKALRALWECSEKYYDNGKNLRSVFEVKVINNALYSEDTYLCYKLRELNFDIWLNPKMVCNHIGHKKYDGSTSMLLDKLKASSND